MEMRLGCEQCKNAVAARGGHQACGVDRLGCRKDAHQECKVDHLGCVDRCNSRGDDTLRMSKLNGVIKGNSRMVLAAVVLMELVVVPAKVMVPAVVVLMELGVVQAKVMVPGVVVLMVLGVVNDNAGFFMLTSGMHS